MKETHSRAAARQQTPVLVVEDDPALRKLVAATLRRADLTVITARDGAEAIERLRTMTFRAIVLDLMMPRVSGWDLVEWLKKNPEKRPRSVVVVTAADRHVFSELDPQIVNAIIVKPFDTHELSGYVSACCDGPTNADRRRKRVIGQA